MDSCETFNATNTCNKPQLIIFWILNTVSLLLFAISAIIGLAEYSNTWYDHVVTYTDSVSYMPFTMDDVIMYILVAILIMFSLFVLALVALKGSVVKDAQFFDAYFGNVAKFVFIPILISCAMFFIGCANKQDDRKCCLIWSLIFALLNIALYIFIYYNLPAPGESWMLFIYKKCFISSLVVFNFYFFFYDICHLAWEKRLKSGEVCSEVFMIIFAVLIAAGIWFLTEVASGLFSWILYIGFVAYSAQGGDQRKNLRRSGELAISIIAMIALLGEIVVICIMKKTQVLY
ncbi:MAG: hypothetical protein MJ252_11545 [archaeon]|nr:hypothetical protein [archaeon]